MDAGGASVRGTDRDHVRPPRATRTARRMTDEEMTGEPKPTAAAAETPS